MTAIAPTSDAGATAPVFSIHPSHLRIVYSQRILKSKDILPLQSDDLWKIESGIVRSLTWDEEGRTMTLGFWGEGDVVGNPLSRMQPYQIECLTNIQMSELLPGSDYLQQALLIHAWKSEALLSIVHQPYVVDRLLRLLEWLADQFGKPVAHGMLLDLRLTHQVLAETIGSTRVSVTRLLSQLEQAGKIQRSQRKLIVCP
jgi:CRP-like cAMP-binding protein